MSKFVKNIITEELKKRLDGVENALLVNVVGMQVNDVNKLRALLAEKEIRILVVKNSLAARATAGTSLKEKQFAKFSLLGGVMDGEAFAADQAVEISKWPTREEQIAILLGQITGVAAGLSSQLLSGGANLASQIKQRWDGDEEAAEEPAAAAAE